MVPDVGNLQKNLSRGGMRLSFDGAHRNGAEFPFGCPVSERRQQLHSSRAFIMSMLGTSSTSGWETSYSSFGQQTLGRSGGNSPAVKLMPAPNRGLVTHTMTTRTGLIRSVTPVTSSKVGTATALLKSDFYPDKTLNATLKCGPTDMDDWRLKPFYGEIPPYLELCKQQSLSGRSMMSAQHDITSSSVTPAPASSPRGGGGGGRAHGSTHTSRVIGTSSHECGILAGTMAGAATPRGSTRGGGTLTPRGSSTLSPRGLTRGSQQHGSPRDSQRGTPRHPWGVVGTPRGDGGLQVEPPDSPIAGSPPSPRTRSLAYCCTYGLEPSFMPENSFASRFAAHVAERAAANQVLWGSPPRWKAE